MNVGILVCAPQIELKKGRKKKGGKGERGSYPLNRDIRY
jgi:hypothetical protein